MGDFFSSEGGPRYGPVQSGPLVALDPQLAQSQSFGLKGIQDERVQAQSDSVHDSLGRAKIASEESMQNKELAQRMGMFKDTQAAGQRDFEEDKRRHDLAFDQARKRLDMESEAHQMNMKGDAFRQKTEEELYEEARAQQLDDATLAEQQSQIDEEHAKHLKAMEDAAAAQYSPEAEARLSEIKKTIGDKQTDLIAIDAARKKLLDPIGLDMDSMLKNLTKTITTKARVTDQEHAKALENLRLAQKNNVDSFINRSQGLLGLYIMPDKIIHSLSFTDEKGNIDAGLLASHITSGLATASDEGKIALKNLIQSGINMASLDAAGQKTFRPQVAENFKNVLALIKTGKLTEESLEASLAAMGEFGSALMTSDGNIVTKEPNEFDTALSNRESLWTSTPKRIRESVRKTGQVLRNSSDLIRGSYGDIDPTNKKIPWQASHVGADVEKIGAKFNKLVAGLQATGQLPPEWSEEILAGRGLVDEASIKKLLNEGKQYGDLQNQLRDTQDEIASKGQESKNLETEVNKKNARMLQEKELETAEYKKKTSSVMAQNAARKKARIATKLGKAAVGGTP